jgi:hypothetical protein
MTSISQAFELVTMGHLRGHGCRALLICCSSTWCNHAASIAADWLPDDTPVRSLCSRMVCTKCGLIGADVRPDWSSHTGGAGMGGAHSPVMTGASSAPLPLVPIRVVGGQ